MLTLSIATEGRPDPWADAREVNAWRDDAGRVFARGYATGNAWWIDWPDLGTFRVTRGSKQVDAWLADTGRAEAAGDAVRRVLQPMLLEALGWQVLHASAAVAWGGVLAFCGRSGSGKSTLAYALALRGCPQFADDAVALDVDGDRIDATPLAFRPRLRPPSADALGTHTVPPARPVISPLPLHAVFMLDQDPALSAPVVELVPPASAFSHLVTHAHCFDAQDPASRKRLVERYLDVAERVQVFAVRYRPDLESIDRLTEAVLAAVGQLDVGRPALTM